MNSFIHPFIDLDATKVDRDGLNTKDEDIVLVESSTELPAYIEVEVKIRGLILVLLLTNFSNVFGTFWD